MILPIALLLVGLALLFFEFFLPGILLGLAGGLALIASAFFSFQEWGGWWSGLFIAGMLLMTALTCKFALYRLGKNKERNHFYLNQDQEGFQASTFNEQLIGKRGYCLSDLKPSGHIQIGEEMHQAISQTGYISKDAPIEVIGGRGSYFLVKTLKKGD